MRLILGSDHTAECMRAAVHFPSANLEHSLTADTFIGLHKAPHLFFLVSSIIMSRHQLADAILSGNA